VLVLSQYVETAHTTDLITLPGFGYLLKDRVLDVGDFLAAAERVSRGGSALDPLVVAGLIGRHDAGDPLGTLTEREREVLAAMAQGLTNAGIAKRLHLSDRTVEAHIRHLLVKLDVPDLADGHRRVLAVLAYLEAQGALS
jgi:DNA-binding NarL/FixJ family response regulator